MRSAEKSLPDRKAVVKIHVRASWDDVEGEVGPKSEKGDRFVPVAETLRVLLASHLLRTGRKGSDLVFGKTATAPFVPWTVNAHAVKAWKEAKLVPIGLHEARHTYVSMMHAAGFSLERIGDYVGHSSAWGGFFDHVPPPRAPDAKPEYELRGFRVPCLVVSPFARRRHVAHGVFDHTSILRMIEWRWSLPPQSIRDAQANNLASVLDFSRRRLAAPRIKVPSFTSKRCPGS